MGMITDENEHPDSDSNGMFTEKWHYNEVRRRWEGNPVLSPDVSDTVASIRHKLNADGNQRTHSATMKKEYMDQMLTWSKSACSLDKAFHYLRSAMAGLGLPPAEGTLDKHTVTKHLEHITFSVVAFTLWTRSVSFLVSAIQCQSNIWYLLLGISSLSS